MPALWAGGRQTLQPNYSDKNMQKTSSKEGIWFEHMPKEKLTYDLPPCQSFAVDNTIILSARGKCSKPTPHCSSTETHTLGCVVFSVECFWGTCPQEEGVTVNQDHRAARPVTQLLALMAGPFTPAAQSHGNVLSDLLILPLHVCDIQPQPNASFYHLTHKLPQRSFQKKC